MEERVEEKKNGFFRNGIFNFVCAVICTIAATAFVYVITLMMLARAGGYHGLSRGEMTDKAMDRISENNMSMLINRLVMGYGGNYYDDPETAELPIVTSDLKEYWVKQAEEYGNMKNVNFAVIVSEKSDLDKIDLTDENTYLYKSPGYDGYAHYLSGRLYRSHFYTDGCIYRIVTNDRYYYGNDHYYEENSYDNVCYIYVLYKTASQFTENRSDYYDNMYLSSDLGSYLSDLYNMDTNGMIYGTFLALGGLIFFVLYCISAGYRSGREGIHLTFVDRIPLEIVYVVTGFTEIIMAAILYNMLKYFNRETGEYFSYGELCFLCCAVFFIAGLIGVGFIGTNIVRIKSGTFWKNTILFRLKDKIFKPISKFGIWAAKHIPIGVLLMTALPVIFVISVVEAALIQDGSDFLAFLFVIGRFAGIALVLYLIWGYTRLREGAKRIAAGNLNEPVDEKHLVADYRLFAEDLNGMSESIQLAVEERMKSERMKTALITNVSHDIKTPLTSIINYIDLLKKEDATEDDKKEYLAILSKQSDRLKKLIQDLIDASKASSGAVDVNLSEIDLCTLAGQVMGEYQDKFEEANLTLVSRIPDKEVKVSADSNLLWRVMDNLYGNVLKYALPGTRVYVDLTEENGRATMSISNISKAELGISGDELMERFVRGDKSRNTEGSGLGLSIAGSLMELMGGSLKIKVDGDMFKAVMEL